MFNLKLAVPLSTEEEKQLIDKYIKTKDLDIRNILVTSNMRLVVTIIREYGYSEDLFSEGCYGLIKGVEKFDPSRGTKLSTYIGFWIRAYVLNYIINNARLVKVGTTQVQRKLFFSLQKEQAKLAAQGIDVTNELVAKQLSVSEKDIEEMQSRTADTSLDKKFGDHDISFVDSLATEENIEEAFALAEYEDVLRSHFEVFHGSLNPKEKIVLQCRMLEDQKLQEVGNVLGVSRERVRQLEGAVKGKLRKFCLNHNIQVSA